VKRKAKRSILERPPEAVQAIITATIMDILQKLSSQMVLFRTSEQGKSMPA
jgi:hypothetical protein